ncbi:hypothetical protein DHEL01_v212405 [Diaporthe helianthi]|uniref:Uncharacterized protein n=1 Tax=Diaporthe helianthi TaxID=158607 RepID=A0A2P5HG32_DIAHE|nr:hypothetical protein DHEL01_v212405 [Diaporthe helianthi]
MASLIAGRYKTSVYSSETSSTIHSELVVCDYPISKPSAPIPCTRSARSDISDLMVNKSGIWGAGFWVPFLQTFGYQVSVKGSQALSMYYTDVRTIHAEEFDTGHETMQDYVNRRVRIEPELASKLNAYRIIGRSLFMVVGIQYAMSMTYEVIRHGSGQGRFGSEGPTTSEIVSRATATGTDVDQSGFRTTFQGEFIFAYQMLEIRARGLRWARPPASIWGCDGAQDDAQWEGDNEDEDCYERFGVQEKNKYAAGFIIKKFML